jgi:hypothetical protein
VEDVAAVKWAAVERTAVERTAVERTAAQSAGVESIQQAHIRAVERQLAAYAEEDRQLSDRLSARARRRAGSSVVYSLRLDPDELAALERRAAVLGLKPSVLARNLVRMGLQNGWRSDRPAEDGW